MKIKLTDMYFVADTIGVDLEIDSQRVKYLLMPKPILNHNFAEFMRDVYFPEYAQIADADMGKLLKVLPQYFEMRIEAQDVMDAATWAALRPLLMFPFFLKVLKIRGEVEFAALPVVPNQTES